MKCLLAVKVQMLVNQPLQIMHLLESCNLCLLTNGAFRSLKSILSFFSIHSCLFVLPHYSFFTNAVFLFYFLKFSLQFFHGLFAYALLQTQMKFLVIFNCVYLCKLFSKIDEQFWVNQALGIFLLIICLFNIT